MFAHVREVIYGTREPLRHAVIMGNRWIVRAPPAYLFCASLEPDFERAKERKEAIFEIRAFRTFVDALNPPAKMALISPNVGRVQYQKFDVNPFEQGLLSPPSHFRKTIDKDWENEIRAVWLFATPSAGSENYPDDVIFSAKDAAQYVRRIA